MCHADETRGFTKETSLLPVMKDLGSTKMTTINLSCMHEVQLHHVLLIQGASQL
jgi:hypothetical protein